MKFFIKKLTSLSSYVLGGFVGIYFYFFFCIAILSPIFFILVLSSFDAVLNHNTTLSKTLIEIAASIVALNSFCIKKISLIKFEPHLIRKLKTELSKLFLNTVLTLVAISAIIFVSPYIKIDFAIIAIVLSLVPLSLCMFKVPSILLSLTLTKYSKFLVNFQNH
jgi:small-conductance mechanosensitive channel